MQCAIDDPSYALCRLLLSMQSLWFYRIISREIATTTEASRVNGLLQELHNDLSYQNVYIP